MKKLGFGMMRLPETVSDEEKRVDLDAVCRMVDLFLERGFTYFDTAYFYHDRKSEIIVREALVKRHPRERFVLADKLPVSFLESENLKQEDVFEEQCQKCGVTYFDYYLLHNLNTEHYEIAERHDSFGFVSRLKAEGRVGKMGFSFHDTAEVLDRILTAHPEVDFVQLQLNYLDWESESVQSRLCYEICQKHGKPVIVMEPVRGGRLATLPKRAERLLKRARPEASAASWALRFAASRESVFMVLSGMSNMEQLSDNLSTMDPPAPMTPEEIALLEETVRIIYEDIAVACTGCRYCVEGCPKQIAIPDLFTLYNAAMQDREGDHTEQRAAYAELTQRGGKASDCIGCRACVKSCPQRIRIVEALKTVAKTLE
ncbi:MAG: aldo/keto reductase [Clostridia bacterium]|nr:aldo/keto reductase [Clostridia bacterium]